ncbi:3-hydroxyacyl-CoA dehydrogenase NAD-binding domain-containing protein, partial [Bradyrhizobium ottawaense]|uniref:3-hydroxyacyl-CoA dehydrogenase NAD-binding domain-containing protein n=1 Tax=Bradyrhizobium ottawaense TaxID=931866 RepID=UPI0030C66E18
HLVRGGLALLLEHLGVSLVHAFEHRQVGAGFMGASVGYVSARAGLDVVLIDRDQESADKGKAHAQKVIEDQIKKGRAKPADAEALLARITPTADYAALKDVD